MGLLEANGKGHKRVLSLAKFQTIDAADSFDQLPTKEFKFNGNLFVGEVKG